MKTQLRTLGLGLVVATVATLAATSSAHAFPGQAPQAQPSVTPPVIKVAPPSATTKVPRLGIMGHVDRGWGMVVDSVVRGTPASRIGLERGDVILRINGQEISSDWAYRKALMRAAEFDNGQLRLQIADVRTGRRVFRVGSLHGNPGVIRPRPFGNDHFGHDHFGQQHVGIQHDHDHDDHAHFGFGHPTALSKTFKSTEW